MESHLWKVLILSFFLHFIITRFCCGYPNVFLQKDEANRVLLYRQRRANSLMEELKLGDLERECLEEKCSYEEAKEIFSFHENFIQFWRTYSEENECNSTPCQNGATCVDHVKSYVCLCPSGYEGRDCEIEFRNDLGCIYMNGGCEHFCVEVPGSPHHCECAPGYSLDKDNTSCIPQVKFPCGRVENHFRPRIVRGTVCPKGECPWQALLENGGAYLCGGIIIDVQWVLTAAHCVYGIPVSKLKVILGEHIRDTHEGTEVMRGVQQKIIHSGYNTSSADNDIALLRLDGGLTYSPDVIPVCLPQRQFALTQLASVRLSTVSGWGKLSQAGPTANVLQRLQVPRVRSQECRSKTRMAITRNMLCAGYYGGEQDSCKGDSGGPLVTRYKNTTFLTGIVSWGKGCAQPGYYGIYTRVSNYLDWLEKLMST